MFSNIDVHNRLQELDIPHEIFKLAGSAASLERAAPMIGLELREMARVELLRADGSPLMVIVPGDRQVDLDKLAALVGASDIVRVHHDEVPELTGYMAGAIPPVALQTEMPAYIDYYTLKEDVVYTGSGEPTAILKIRSYDLVRATGAEIVDVVLPLETAEEGR